MSSTKPLIAFFGATGGCAAAALSQSLKNGYMAIALARKPSKLVNLMAESHSVPNSTIKSNLTIIQGSVTDSNALKVILSRSPILIISGIGAAPKFQVNPLHPIAMDQPTICADAMSAVVDTLRSLKDEGKLRTRPLVVTISSTGLSKTRDVPIALLGLYHVVLANPHKDKKNMETALVKATLEPDSPILGYTIVRPTLLTGGAGKGTSSIRAGWEKHDQDHAARETGPGPAIGYSISRADVGSWIYENIINGPFMEFNGRCVSLAN